MITHGADAPQVYDAWSELAGLRAGDRYLLVNPFFHTFGYKAGIIACLLRGATIVPQPVFDVAAVAARIVAASGSPCCPGPPTLYQSILDHPDRGALRPVDACGSRSPAPPRSRWS